MLKRLTFKKSVLLIKNHHFYINCSILKSVGVFILIIIYIFLNLSFKRYIFKINFSLLTMYALKKIKTNKLKYLKISFLAVN